MNLLRRTDPTAANLEDVARAVGWVLVLLGLAAFYCCGGWLFVPFAVPDRVQRWMGWR